MEVDLTGRRRVTSGSIVVSVAAWAVIIGTGWFLFVNPGRVRTILFPPKPCSSVIRYSFGSIDPRFNVSTSTLRADVETATGMWSTAAGKTLFAYDPNGPLKINFIYDNRQAATDELKKLGISISNDRASFDALKTKYAAERASYTAKKAALDALAKEYDAKVTAYNAKVKSSGARVPEGVFEELKREKADLDAEAARVQKSQSDLNALVDQLNAMGRVLNRQANALNLKIDQTNNVSQSNGQEFEEGLYTSDENGTTIAIYSFDSSTDLIGVLAHEFGHALGLDHVNDPTAIMYYLDQGGQDHLSQTDINAVRGLCRIP
jgi:hypothetical protein